MEEKAAANDPELPLVNRQNHNVSKYVLEDGEDIKPSESSVREQVAASLPPNIYENISYRLSRRKVLLVRRRRIVDLELALALFGILLMLIDTELYIGNVYNKDSAGSKAIKSFITISTLGLVASVLFYHKTGIDLNMIENGYEDWRLAVTTWTYIKVSIEIVVCLMHPLPGNIKAPYTPRGGDPTMVSIDAVLSILMLLRLYLVGKFMVVHSRLLTDTSTQSLGALNKVKINTTFVFKALMSTMPGTMLVCLMVAMLLLNSWSMRTCEAYYHPDAEHTDIGNTVWMIAITFLTVGYGDLFPHSECGRFISILTGFMGVATTALLVAVISSKLEQTRAEKYVYNFVARVQYDKDRKNAAADVIKHVMQLWRLKKRGFFNDEMRIRVHGKLLQAIQNMRSAKAEKMNIGDSAIGFIEVAKGVDDVFNMLEEMQVTHVELNDRVSSLEKTITNIDTKLDTMHSALFQR